MVMAGFPGRHFLLVNITMISLAFLPIRIGDEDYYERGRNLEKKKPSPRIPHAMHWAWTISSDFPLIRS